MIALGSVPTGSHVAYVSNHHCLLKTRQCPAPGEVTLWSEGNIAPARKATERRALQVMAVLDAMPSSNLRPEDETEVEASRVYRTTYMFSATMPPSVERLARKCVAGFHGSRADAVHLVS